MINNKAQQTNMNTNSSSESSIYLKKSELPKNISSFKNDVGYISSATLSSWMKEHAYISKDEINVLIKRANLVVVDSINKSLDDEAVARLNRDIIDMKGEIVAIKDRLTNVETDYIPTSKERNFATKGDIRTITNRIDDIINEIPSIDIDTTYFAKKSDIPTKVSQLQNDANYLTRHQSLKDYAKKSDIPDTSRFITADDIPSIDGIATKEWVENKRYLTKHQSLKDYVKKSDIPDITNLATKDEIPSVDGLASKEWVENKRYLTSHQSLSDYVKKSDVPDITNLATKDEIPSMEGIATKEWVENKRYLTSHQSLSEYMKKSEMPDIENLATKDEIPSVDGLASKEWVENKRYLTSHQSLSEYMKKSEMPSLDGLATQEWVLDQGFITDIQDLDSYAKKTDLENYVKTSALNFYAKKNSVYDKNYIDDKILSKADAGIIYETKEDADDTFLSKTDARKQYLQIEDYIGLKDASVISKAYRTKTLEELEADLQLLRNGFYIVNYNDMVIVEDHKVVKVFENGVGAISWIVEDE